jgi:hypothetical protein
MSPVRLGRWVADARNYILRKNVYDFLIASLAFELDHACDLGEERVILALSYVEAGIDLIAALARDDRAGRDRLTTVRLYAQPLTVRITTITRTANALFMCHTEIPYQFRI